jgi:uncharacterized membrane protein
MRLLLKTASYGVVHIVVATAVAYALTGNLAVALSIGLIEPIVQTFVFSLHDWLWEGKTSFKHSHAMQEAK